MTKIAVKRPVKRVAIKGPGIVKGVRVASGPTGPAGAAGANGVDGVIQFVNGKTGASVTLNAGDVGAQPSDADLTAIAALTTTAYGRAFLALANQAALMALVQASSETAQGKIEIATQAETNAGTDDARAVTPLKLQTRLAAYAQPLDADLTAIAALASAANKMLYATGAGAWSLADLTAAGRALLDDTDAATQRATLEAAGSTGGGREKSAPLSATTGTATGDLNAASIFTVVPTGNITLAFSNVPASGTACSLRVRVAQGATPRSVTMPSGIVHWFTAEPTQTANKVTVYEMETLDSGTNWDVWAAVEK